MLHFPLYLLYFLTHTKKEVKCNDLEYENMNKINKYTTFFFFNLNYLRRKTERITIYYLFRYIDKCKTLFICKIIV